ncbi:MAG: DedA family protein [Planctomycetota bacterium]|jgi:membrane protein DedA with SNARE-associated domain|nr:DedA family protein [Planctomycetota bacterium]
MVDLLAHCPNLLAQVPLLLAQASDAAASAAAAAPAPEAAGPWVQWLADYGAIFIFIAFIVCGVGLHVSEDFLLIPAGVAIYEGHMTWTETLLAAYFGLVIGDTLWIWVCRNYGTRLIHSKRFLRMMHPRKLLEAKHAMSERGVIVLILARFIPGTRTPVLTMTGLLHMPWWKFLAVELTTVAVTVPVQVSVGWLGKAGYDKAKDLGGLLTFGLAGIALTVAFVIGYRWYKQAKARKGPRPRAPVSWLRTFGRGAHKHASPSPSPR